ncbi:Heterogeneous nuclear ribonucleoprotein U-like protein 1 [Porphyridium purpureum]|uniref:Heterogeneous nuclear ribonucleoprotein U-like protein 1 n=1 Tax=Porphyridium purpureum TaxID=35688 RepID=A0A5J4Z5G2_PORPP|nr:Heterogeneous nuclear ribonucleoprotein U-like protein 1 [Porphyridium purpureum]|eukprot:POR8288..scf295_1
MNGRQDDEEAPGGIVTHGAVRVLGLVRYSGYSDLTIFLGAKDWRECPHKPNGRREKRKGCVKVFATWLQAVLPIVRQLACHPAPRGRHMHVSGEMDLENMKVDDLRKELKGRGLDSAGVKAVLKDRLKAAIDQEQGDVIVEDRVTKPALNDNAPQPEEKRPIHDASADDRVDSSEAAAGVTTKASESKNQSVHSEEEEERRIIELEEKRKVRAARFNIPYEPLARTEQLRKEKRALRFGGAGVKTDSDAKRQKAV